MATKKIQPDEVQEKKVTQVPYTIETWKGVKNVVRCSICGTYRDDVDAMIEHVIMHYPRGDQEEIFDKLMKEK